MSDTLKAELAELDAKIERKTEELKALKKARRKLNGALEQMKLL
jgi:chromosome segregation ATPase